MTNMPPDPKSSQTNALGFDEFIAILVAFISIGAILFWSLSRNHSSWNLDGLLLPSPSAVPTSPANKTAPTIEPRKIPLSTEPSAKQTPFVVTSLPTLAPAQPSKAILQAPLPSPFSTMETFPLVVPAEQKSTIPPPIAFTDIPDDFWARRFIDALSSRNIIKGYQDNSFRPNQPVTRAEFAAILQQAFDKEFVHIQNSSIPFAFKDVPEQFWAISAIKQSISTGFLKGYPDQTFRVQQNIPRVQVLVALASGLSLNTPASPNQILSIYQDAKAIPAYAKEKVAAATANTLAVNYPNPAVLAPNQPATRAEVAAMVHQALVRRGRLGAVESKNIIKLPN